MDELQHLRQRRAHLIEATSRMFYVPLRDRLQLQQFDVEIARLEKAQPADKDYG